MAPRLVYDQSLVRLEQDGVPGVAANKGKRGAAMEKWKMMWLSVFRVAGETNNALNQLLVSTHPNGEENVILKLFTANWRLGQSELGDLMADIRFRNGIPPRSAPGEFADP